MAVWIVLFTLLMTGSVWYNRHQDKIRAHDRIDQIQELADSTKKAQISGCRRGNKRFSNLMTYIEHHSHDSHGHLLDPEQVKKQLEPYRKILIVNCEEIVITQLNQDR